MSEVLRKVELEEGKMIGTGTIIYHEYPEGSIIIDCNNYKDPRMNFYMSGIKSGMGISKDCSIHGRTRKMNRLGFVFTLHSKINIFLFLFFYMIDNLIGFTKNMFSFRTFYIFRWILSFPKIDPKRRNSIYLAFLLKKIHEKAAKP